MRWLVANNITDCQNMFYAFAILLFYKIAQYDMHFEAQGG